MPWGLFCFSFPWLQVRDWDPEMDAPEDLKREVLDNWVQSYGFWTSEEFAWVHEELGNSMIVVSDFSWNGVLWLQMLHPSQCVAMEQIAGWIECTNPDRLLSCIARKLFLPILHNYKWSPGPSQCFTLSMPIPLNSLPFPIIHLSQGNYPKLPPLPMLVLLPSLSSPKDIGKADSSRTLITSMTELQNKMRSEKQLNTDNRRVSKKI